MDYTQNLNRLYEEGHNNIDTNAFSDKADCKSFPLDLAGISALWGPDPGPQPHGHLPGPLGSALCSLGVAVDSAISGDVAPIVIQPEDQNLECDAFEVKQEKDGLYSQEQVSTQAYHDSGLMNKPSPLTNPGQQAEIGTKIITVAVKYEDCEHMIKENSAFVIPGTYEVDAAFQSSNEVGFVSVKCEDASSTTSEEQSLMDVKLENEVLNAKHEDESLESDSSDCIVLSELVNKRKALREDESWESDCSDNIVLSELVNEKKALRGDESWESDGSDNKFLSDYINKTKKVNKSSSSRKRGKKSKSRKRNDSTFCRICNRQFVSYSALKLHRRSHDKNKPHICQICGLRFSQVAYVKVHMKCHISESCFPCGVCGKSLANAKELDIHTKHHRRLKSKYAKSTCKICGKRVPTKTLRNHTRKHDKVFYPCLECGRHCKSKQDLALHRCYKDEKPIICQTCNEVFYNTTLLAYHMTLHKGVITDYCHLCGQGFTSCYHLDQHFHKVHPHVKCYECDGCEKKFSRRRHLKKHQLVHSQDRPYPCNFCNSRFANESSFSIHIRTHTGETPYSCTRCGMAFVARGMLKGHMMWSCQGKAGLRRKGTPTQPKKNLRLTSLNSSSV